jgi:hypothetical protein
MSHSETAVSPQNFDHAARASVQEAGRQHALTDPLQALDDYVTFVADGRLALADVDRLLYRLLGKSAPLERGVVGPTGASSTISFSVLGPIFGIYGFYAGSQIIARAGNARAYLQTVETAVAALRSEHAALQRRLDAAPAAPTDTLVATLQDLHLRCVALENFCQGVHSSVREQNFNQAFPGAVQLTASVLILALAFDFAPTLFGGTKILSSGATAALGGAAAGVLGVYALGSLAKNLLAFTQALRTHRMPLEPQESAQIRRSKADYNRGVRSHRLFYGLNSASWATYVGAAGALVAISSGVALSHGVAVGAVVTGALAAVIWDCFWGRSCAPHNALTPHIDRNYLDSPQRRLQVWEHLTQQQKLLGRATNDVVQELQAKAPGHAAHYRHFWQYVPKVGGVHRLGHWAKKDCAWSDAPLRDYMMDYTDLEIKYTQARLASQLTPLLQRRGELLQAAGSGATPSPELKTLETLWEQDFAALCDEQKKLAGYTALTAALRTLDVQSVRRDAASLQEWNKLRLSFMTLHALVGLAVKPADVRRQPQWFHFTSQRSRLLRRTHYSAVRLSQKGYEALSQQGLGPLERQFLEALLSSKSNRYEREALHKIEGALHLGQSQHAAAMNDWRKLSGAPAA